jgi:hypothetical protein
VAEDLRARIVALYDRHLSPDGRNVGYGAMRRDPDFWAYVDAAAELQRVRGTGGLFGGSSATAAPLGASASPLRMASKPWPPNLSLPCFTPPHTHNPETEVDLSSLGRDALTAFAINTYNALIIHTLVAHGTERYRSTLGRKDFFSNVRADPAAGAGAAMGPGAQGLSAAAIAPLPGMSHGSHEPWH